MSYIADMSIKSDNVLYSIAIWPLSMGNFWLTILDASLLFVNAFFNYFVISQVSLCISLEYDLMFGRSILHSQKEQSFTTMFHKAQLTLTFRLFDH